MGRFYPAGDAKYKNYLLMMEVTDYLLAPEINLDEVAYVKTAIEDHHRAFTTLYPTATVIPKFHYIIHMPRLISQ